MNAVVIKITQLTDGFFDAIFPVAIEFALRLRMELIRLRVRNSILTEGEEVGADIVAVALPNTVFRGQTKMKYYIDQQSSMLKIVESLFGG